MSKSKILIVDDESGVRFGMREFLEAHGYEAYDTNCCRGAEDMFRAMRPDAAVIDYLLPDGTALDLLPRLKAIDPGAPLIILTGHGSIDLAVRAIKEGAEQFLTKPLDLSTLLVILERLLENQRNLRKQIARKSQQARQAVDPFIGSSAAIRQLAEQSKRVLSTESPILLLGETGVGKGVLSQWIHNNSARCEEPFVDLNCAGLSQGFLETELFGHEKGAFTGATTSKLGLFEVAHRGTVFLDEIGDVDLQVQPKLLKVLEEQKFRRLGSVRDRQVDVRLVAATCQDLSRLMRENRFRSDLYYRISTIPLMTPALRERVEDIPALARHLLAKCAADLGRNDLELSPDAERALLAYAWPGNIRELRNVLERAALLSERRILLATDLRFDDAAKRETPVYDSQLSLLELERRHIELVLAEENGQVERAAKRLGIPRSSLYQKIKKFQITTSKV
ncbi:MAG TPA: sigma-54 dependent transcriptional regulator [Blastocatellia bacterium]|nr:sigma-54 dependent transcriptional regulator [Blastocatellia bacterium]